MKPKKVAIVAEWLTSRGGAESVVYELAKIFQDADIFTTAYAKENHPEIQMRKVNVSFLKRIPILNKRHQLALLLLPKAIQSLNLSSYDLIISSSSAFGKGIKKPFGSHHICYCHTPMRWVWEPHLDSRLKKIPLSAPLIKWLKEWDLKMNQDVDVFVANSKNTQAKIKKFYNRDSELIYPPINLNDFYLAPNKNKEDFYFTISRLVDYKRIDLAIKACENLNRKLYVAGIGPELKNLKKVAGKNTVFLGRITQEKKVDLFKKAKATIFCAEEDFGIVPVESLASGTPVIGYKKGGILEVVENYKNGILFDNQTTKDVENAIIEFEEKKFDSNLCVKSSEKFDEKKFKDNILKIIENL